MSRIGKKPVAILDQVDVNLDGSTVTVKGPKGTLTRTFSPLIEIKIQGKEVVSKPLNQSKSTMALWGTTNAVINNLIIGVSKGFEKKLKIVGVGYRAKLDGKTVVLSLGFSHPVILPIPEDIDVKIEKATVVTISGINKEVVGQFAANIRKIRKPNPYSGKGVMYIDEKIRRKEGKTAKSA